MSEVVDFEFSVLTIESCQFMSLLEVPGLIFAFPKVRVLVMITVYTRYLTVSL